MRILIIKLGASGDVLRTTPLVRALKNRYPQSQISWLTSEKSYELLSHCPMIDRLLAYTVQNYSRLVVEEFDMVINFDKDCSAAAVATSVKATTKYGFGLSKSGTIHPLTKESEYSLMLGLSDTLKFKQNNKTYQEMLFESVGLCFQKEEYIFEVCDRDRAWAKDYYRNSGVSDEEPLIGLNTGGGDIFAHKGWTPENFSRLATLCIERFGVKVALLGGPEEKEKNSMILNGARLPIIDTGSGNTLGRFAALIERCSVLVSGDTLGMHLAIATAAPVVALFLSTCPKEIEFYGRGVAVNAEVDCAPCYKRSCEIDACIGDVSVERVINTVAGYVG